MGVPFAKKKKHELQADSGATLILKPEILDPCSPFMFFFCKHHVHWSVDS